MTTMHGPEATTIIRHELGYTGLIIGVTGNSLSEDIAIFRDSGANAVLVKPLTPVKFYELLKELKVIKIDGIQDQGATPQVAQLADV